ncbi:MAG: hypothetical protein AAGG69_07785, partial [Pseudomonadota bacterium]
MRTFPNILASILVFFALAVSAFAQTLPEQVDEQVQQVSRLVDSLAARFQENLDSEDALVDLNASITSLQADALQLGV